MCSDAGSSYRAQLKLKPGPRGLAVRRYEAVARMSSPRAKIHQKRERGVCIFAVIPRWPSRRFDRQASQQKSKPHLNWFKLPNSSFHK